MKPDRAQRVLVDAGRKDEHVGVYQGRGVEGAQRVKEERNAAKQAQGLGWPVAHPAPGAGGDDEGSDVSGGHGRRDHALGC